MAFSKQEKTILYLLASVSFTNILDFMVMMPLGHEFQTVFSLSPPQWSTVVSAYTFAAGISGVTSIFFIDKIERKRFLLTLYIGFIIGTIFCGLAQGYYTLVAARAFTGIFGGVINALLFALVGDLIKPQDRGKGIGILMMGFSPASALGVPFGLYFGVTFSWRVPFFAIAAMGLVLLVLLFRYIPVVDTHVKLNKGQSPLPQLLQVFKNPNQLKALAGAFAMFCGHFIIVPFLAPYMVSNVGFEEVQLTWIYFAGGVITIFTSPFIGKLSDQIGKFPVMAILAFLATIPMVIITNLESAPVWFVLIFTTVFFITGGRSIPGNAIILSTALPAQRGSFMSIRAAVQQFASATAAFSAGFILTQTPDGKYDHYEIAGYVGVLLTIISVIILKKVKEQY
ncbi:MFS transporter [Limibacter armeniacum]|uniref:MFS transporter n=1 Tax=Limibacter armeniacum TaxID=466084 RepID=UPI002FE6C403